MIAALAALTLLVAPATLDVPPEIDEPAVATRQAERLDAPAPPPTEVLPEVAAPDMDDCAEMSWYRVRAGLPARFDKLGWRESNCRNEEGVHTSCCWGWFQLSVDVHLRDHRLAGPYHDCGVYSRHDVDSDTPEDKLRQACAARALFDVVGYSAWSTS